MAFTKLKTENSKLKTNIVFFGTPELTVPILDELKENGFAPSLIVTAPDKPAGRGMVLTPPPAKIWAEKNNIPVLQPIKLDNEFISRIKTENYQLFIVAAYGKILPQAVLDIPTLGAFNVHYSLLPKYRGASPVESAILNGEKETGVCVQKMAFEMDAGDIVAEEKTEILDSETAPELKDRLNEIAKKLLIKTVRKITDGTANYRGQNHGEATFTKKITKEDGLIEISGNPKINWNKYRALYGWPGVYFFAERKNGEKVRVSIKDASFENGQFTIKRVLPDGKKEMDYRDFLRGL